jgi:DNA-binding NtrC family response regulator
LAEFFLQKHSPADSMELPPRLCKALLEHDWPGNIRELENIIRRFLVFRNADLIAAELKRKTRTTILVASPGLQTLSAERLRSGLTGPPETVHFAAPDIRNESRSHARSAGSALATDPGTLQGARAQHSAPNLTSSSVPGAQDPSGHSSILTEVDEARKTAEARAILSALNSTLWNRKQAAKLLKVDYKALLYKMKKLKIGEKETATQSDTTSKSHPS